MLSDVIQCLSPFVLEEAPCRPSMAPCLSRELREGELQQWRDLAIVGSENEGQTGCQNERNPRFLAHKGRVWWPISSTLRAIGLRALKTRTMG